MSLYGLAFTKEDHIYFVRLQYELIVSKKSMDLYHVAYASQCFAKLMRKRFIISNEELQLDWRPLYETYERLLYSETETLGLRFVPENLESNLSYAIRLARPHFNMSATQEMLDEWRPMLCPFSVSIQRAVTYLNLFLPTTLPPEHHDKGFRLWFDEVIRLWLSGKICLGTYESKLTLLLSRLSSDCMGFIDWDPYISGIFNHFKTSLNLTAGMNRSNSRRVNESIDVGPCIQWVVYMINTKNTCLEHIKKLFKAIESFYHPSNTDKRWHLKLQQFLYKLPACYVKRLYRERFKKNIWSRRVPEFHKLTDEQTTEFVDALMPVVLTSMFNQQGIASAALAFRDLSVLRPERVIPPILERLYGSYETLTEPHRLLASINCMSSVVPAMVRPCKYFPEGPSHVLPLLLNSLPGIDSNDMRKCIAVFRFIATLAAHIRMRDYSYLVDKRSDLSFEQQQLCLSTAQFEDFVIQFLDKCFILIENTASATFSNLDQESKLKNGEEGIVEAAISSVALGILAQASPEIQRAALDKIYSHVTRHLFDTKTQGKAIASLCLACAKSSPKETLAKFVPHFGRLILTLTDNEEVFQESTLDDELLFSLLLISEIVRCNSPYILDYRDMIISVLNRALNLSAKDGYMLGCGILRHLVRALTNISSCDWRNIDFEVEKNRQVEDEWPFDNWGHTTHISELNVKWEIPSPESQKFAQDLLEHFLRQATADLIAWTKGKKQLSREQIQRSLHIVLSSLFGGASVLPPLESTPIELCPFEVPIITMCVKNTGTEPLNFADGTNIRTWVIESLQQVLSHTLKVNEDDTKSLTLICEIFTTAISYFGYNKTEIRLAAQRIKSMKSSAQNKLLGSKRHLRYLLVERVAQQHRAMLLNKGQPEFTELHLVVLKSLFGLSQSHYVEVRILAQDTIYMMLNHFPFSETILVPMLVDELRKPEIEHNKFKGLLHLVVGRRSCNSIVVDPNWSYLRKIWPALVESPHSEKPSIVKLLDRICNLVQKGFDTFELHYKFPDEIKEKASRIWSSSTIDPLKYQPPDAETLDRVMACVDERNKQRIIDYEQLVLKLVELIDDPHIHWHRRIVAYNLFTHLMREDHPLPLPALDLCLSSLISERLSIRLKAIQLVTAQLKIHKRKHKKRLIRFLSESSIHDIESKAERISLNEGDNDEQISGQPKQLQVDNYNIFSNSNEWMQYKLSDENYTKEEWNKLIFIDKPHIGFYEWPKELQVYEPHDKQPKLDRPTSELDEFELCIYRKFNDADFIDKLVGYFCFEDNKCNNDQHRFDLKRPALFKGIFRNYGPCLIRPFEKYILEHASSNCEHKQKFVIEFLAGLLRGSKHWSYEMLQDLRKFVLPILDMLPLTQENFTDWTGLSNYVLRHRDVKRLGWMFNYFIKKAISESEVTSPTITPFMQGCRLTLAHYSMIQCEWRAVDHIFPIVVDSLKLQDHLLSYANVRTCLASIYSLIFMFDDPTLQSRIPGTLKNGPKRKDFIDFLLPKLSVLEISKRSSTQLFSMNDEPVLPARLSAFIDKSPTPDKTNQPLYINPITGEPESFVADLRRVLPTIDVDRTARASSNTNSEPPDEPQERKDAIKLMKLTSCWIIYNVSRMKSPVPADFFKLLPVICEMGRESNDPELAADSLAAVAILASSILSDEAVDEALLCVRRIIACHSWHARVMAAFLIEIMVSTNFFKLISVDKWRAEIEDIVINYLICDERIEVRESSSVTLSGMIHCEFTKLTPTLISEFKRRASEPLIKRKQPNGSTAIDSNSIVTRHSGILCLCACVDAYPYTVPDHLPELLTLLSDHLTDPQPISVSNGQSDS